MHNGGALGSGAPEGNKNAWKHGRYSTETINAKRETRAMIREMEVLLDMAY